MQTLQQFLAKFFSRFHKVDDIMSAFTRTATKLETAVEAHVKAAEAHAAAEAKAVAARLKSEFEISSAKKALTNIKALLGQ